MTEQFVLHLGKQALVTTLLLSAPMLVTGLIVGLAVGIFQAVTQINEITLTFVPKILVVMVSFLIFMSWMMHILLRFTTSIFNSISVITH
ncbi:flagellar biosynthetic protein FliQ [bacterium BMS3Abin05]|nr:flagellar biosynthetic protein FliQ [bacterium BMS3Abin05]GBE28837.1 flagellar biosynthetic protein FliQ [bacterium BMS3Bbin03]HDL78188.1 flagellar biosynthesis protein FliQ [Bacteroidota bacterium]HDZ11083.1 flagellar biosynthesis protein FliQ [Bacteroidota bacterium]